MVDNQTLPVHVAALLTKILREEVDPEKLDASLDDEYGANSMDVVEIAESMERNFGVKIGNDQIRSIRTLGDILKLIETKD